MIRSYFIIANVACKYKIYFSKTPQSGWAVSGLRFESKTSWVQGSIANQSAQTSVSCVACYLKMLSVQILCSIRWFINLQQLVEWEFAAETAVWRDVACDRTAASQHLTAWAVTWPTASSAQSRIAGRINRSCMIIDSVSEWGQCPACGSPVWSCFSR
jgi:hypothetical protein